MVEIAPALGRFMVTLPLTVNVLVLSAKFKTPAALDPTLPMVNDLQAAE
jgi:hypothetical protein